MRHQSSFIELSSKNSGTSNNIKIGHIGPSVQNKAVCIYLLWLQVFKRFPCVTLKFWSLFKYYFLPFEHPVSNRKSKVQILLLLMLKQNCKRSMYSSCFSRFQPWRLNYEDNVKDSLRPFLPEKQVIKNWLDRIQGLSKVILLLIKYSLYKKCGSVFVSFSEEMCVVYVWLVHSHCNKCVVFFGEQKHKVSKHQCSFCAVLELPTDPVHYYQTSFATNSQEKQSNSHNMDSFLYIWYLLSATL